MLAEICQGGTYGATNHNRGTAGSLPRRLQEEERSPATVEKYGKEAARFAVWLEGRPVTKEAAVCWREELLAKG